MVTLEQLKIKRLYAFLEKIENTDPRHSCGVALGNIRAGTERVMSMEWISVEDRLPSPNTTVLVCNAKKCRGKVWMGYVNELNEWSVDYITHWMPLPVPHRE